MRPITKIVLLGLALRILFILISLPVNNYDLLAYENVGRAVINHLNIYPFPAILYHPYLPVMLYIEALTKLFGVWQPILLKLVFSLFDAGNIYLVYKLTRRPAKLRPGKTGINGKNDQSIVNAFLYAVNPISILITAYHGQFDSLPLFLLLATIFWKNPWLLSLAVAVKTWPVFFLLPLIRRWHDKKNVLLLAFFPALSLILYALFFHIAPLIILRTIAGYRAVFGAFGISRLYLLFGSSPPPIQIRAAIIVFLSLFFTYSAHQKKSRLLITEIFQLMLVFFILTPVFGIQWFIWLIPFLLLCKPRGAIFFYAVTTLLLITSYLQWSGVSVPFFIFFFGLLSWLALIRMFFYTLPISVRMKLPFTSNSTR
ncbi:hypothetical protein HY214_03190 [Candidatus Roizmanbacteria bacterium]|nr:hypothetical protein [Candidatus Roizmanbacteria bacterium]